MLRHCSRTTASAAAFHPITTAAFSSGASASRRPPVASVTRITPLIRSASICPLHAYSFPAANYHLQQQRCQFFSTNSNARTGADQPAPGVADAEKKVTSKRKSTSKKKKSDSKTDETPTAAASSASSSSSAPLISTTFSGLTFCVTGSHSLTQSAFQTLLESHGAHVIDTVNKSCTHLIADKLGSTKTKRAALLNIPIVTDAWVQESIEEGILSTDRSLYLSTEFDLHAERETKTKDIPAKIQQRVAVLHAELRRANELYYGSGKDTGLTDAQYDELFKELQSLETDYPNIITKDSPTQSPGSNTIADPTSSSSAASSSSSSSPSTITTLPHRLAMLSLQSCTSYDDVRKWDASLQRGLTKLDKSSKSDVKQLRYNLELKYDGIAISLIYKNKQLYSVCTRGNGTIGEDIRVAVERWVKNVPQSITIDSSSELAPYAAGMIEVRGEILLTTSSHQQWTRDMQARGKNAEEDGSQTPPRNLCSGLLRRDMAALTKEESDSYPAAPLTFVAYAMHIHHPSIRHVSPYLIQPPNTDEPGHPANSQILPATQTQSLQLLQSMGLPTTTNVTSKASWTCDGIESVISALREQTLTRDQLDFGIDGIVIKLDDLSLSYALGVTSHHPKSAMAYKFAAKTAQTTLIDVEWQVSREGRVVPVARFQPVKIDGVSIQKASLHNCSIFRDLKLAVGDTVLIARRGDVIPHLSEKIASTPGAKRIPFPLHCPCSLRSPLEERESTSKAERTELYCSSASCPTLLTSRIEHYCSKGALDIDGMATKTIEELHSLGFLNSLEDVLRFPERREEFARLQAAGWQEKRLDRICTSIITAHQQASEARLLVAAGLPRLGRSQAKSLLQHFGSIEKLLAATEEQLISVPGVGEKSVPMYLTAFAQLKTGLVPHWKKYSLLGGKAQGSEVESGEQ